MSKCCKKSGGMSLSTKDFNVVINFYKSASKQQNIQGGGSIIEKNAFLSNIYCNVKTKDFISFIDDVNTNIDDKITIEIICKYDISTFQAFRQAGNIFYARHYISSNEYDEYKITAYYDKNLEKKYIVLKAIVESRN